MVEGSDLWLTMGDHMSQRLAFNDVVNEKYTVRQVAPTGADGTTKVEVSALTSCRSTTCRPAGGSKANGLDGDDTVRLYPGRPGHGQQRRHHDHRRAVHGARDDRRR